MFSFVGRTQNREARPAAPLGFSGQISAISYAADAFVFELQELLLRQLHVQEVVEHQPIPQHGALQGRHIPSETPQMALVKAHVRVAGELTCCAFPRVSSAVVRGGLRKGRPVWRPYFPEAQTGNRSVAQRVHTHAHTHSHTFTQASQHTSETQAQEQPSDSEQNFSHRIVSASVSF